MLRKSILFFFFWKRILVVSYNIGAKSEAGHHFETEGVIPIRTLVHDPRMSLTTMT